MSDDVDFGAIASEVTAKLEGAIDPAPVAVEPDPVPAVEVAAVPDASVTPEPAPATEVDPYDDEGVQTFSRGYVKRIREREEKARTERSEAQQRWDQWNQAVEGWDDEQQGLARDLLVAIREGDMAKVVGILGPDALAEAMAPGTQPQPTEPEDRPLTKAEFERELAEREAAKEKEANIRAVYSQAKTLGYDPEAKPGTEAFGRWVMLVQYAQAAGGIEEGHKQLEAVRAAERQRYIDEFVSSRSNGSPAPAGNSGAASRDPEDAWLEKSGNPLEAAKRRAMERVSAERTQVG